MKFYLTSVLCTLLLLNNLCAQTLNGKWECESTTFSITKQNGTTLTALNNLKEKGVSIIWEFMSNSKFIARQDNLIQEGTWELKGSQLILRGNFTKEIAQAMGLKELIYEVEQKGNKVDFSVDATKMGPYKKNILTYTFKKL
ncbi:hypothetical protein [Emticicia agri]|uniref:Lipocalin-like domain-containing protein n=1 Tax=Emticicia agri TaxID=2492393 RepID=A0A4V1ZD36_9BACT|nr:hypothetical protein [Emticicia agri]RYU94790.1 hypothetical protein EWM59_14870 [Emticicia agri]